MPRSGKVEKRKIQSDLLYASPTIAKLINKIMVSGKKQLAQKIVYKTLESIAGSGNDPVATLEKALENISPKMEVRPRRVGGASYMIPMEVHGARKQSLAISWLIAAARNRPLPEINARPKNNPTMIAKLTAEIVEASRGEGNAVAKKTEMHRMADANKAFAHFRW